MYNLDQDEIPDYYEILCIGRDADTTEIIKAYKENLQKLESGEYNRNISYFDLEFQFALCLEAFRTLSDPERKEKYDYILSHELKKKPLKPVTSTALITTKPLRNKSALSYHK